MEDTCKRKSLAIIGGGISGILSCKIALENGLNVKLFEKNSELLGNWKMNSQVWNHLVTNISKYNTQFSDFVWNDTSNIFANKKELNIFLTNYVKEFEIEKNCNFNSKVVNIRLMEDLKFEIYYINLNKELKEIFDFVIVASGNYAIPNIPKIDWGDIKNIIHSSQFTDSNQFKGKKVLVIGNGHSGCEISSEVSYSASSVINLYKEKAWIIPKFIFSKDYNKILPYDLASVSLKKLEELKTLNTDSLNKMQNNRLAKITGQNEIHSHLFIDPESIESFQISISSDYLNCVKKGLILPEFGSISKIEGKTVYLDNDHKFEIDCIILCTGFKRDYSFIDENLLKIIFKTDNQTNLKYSIFHPNLNIAFIAIEKAFFCLLELEAKLAINHFLKKIVRNAINEKEYFKFVGNVPFRFVQLAHELQLLPNLEIIKSQDIEFYRMIIDGPLLPQIIYLNGPNEKINKFNIEYIKKVSQDLKRGNLVAKF